MCCTLFKYFLRSILLLPLFLVSPAQTIITIGGSSYNNSDIPFNGKANYSWSAAIYQQSNIHTEGLITHFAYDITNDISDLIKHNQKIYMGLTSESSYGYGSKPDPGTLSLVYDGTIRWNGSSWQLVPLQTPFYYSNTEGENLVIYWENRSGTSSSSNYPLFASFYNGSNSTAIYNSASDVLPGDGSLSDYTPGILFMLQSGPKYFDYAIVEQNETPVAPGTENQEIILIKTYVAGLEGDVTMNGFQLNTQGTTHLSDISNLRVWYTGADAFFTTTTQFGPTIAKPGSSNVFTTTPQTLAWGDNHFWVTYDIPVTATVGNIVDAGCDIIYHNDGQYWMEAGNPEGEREITNPLSGEVTLGEGTGQLSLSAIVEIINGVGLAGNTTINIPDGIYTETNCLSMEGWTGDYSLTFSRPPDASDVATVTSEAPLIFNNIKGLTINGKNSLVFINPSTDQPVIQLRNSKNTTIEGVKIFGNSTNWWATGNLGLLNLRAGSENTIISGCVFGGIPGGEDLPGFVIGLGENGEAEPITNTIIMRNQIGRFGDIGVYVGFNTYTTTISGNFISGTDDQYSFVGIDDVGQGTRINGNFIYFPGILKDYGYYIGIDQNAVRNGGVYNNFIYGAFSATNNLHSIGGMTFSANVPEFSTSVKHNTIYLTGHSSGGEAFVFNTDYPGGSLNFSNNIVSQLITGTSSIAAVNFAEDPPAGFTMNNNNYNLSSGLPFGYLPGFTTTVPVTSMDLWTATTGLEINSTSGMVPFNQTGDPHISVKQEVSKVQQDYSYLEIERDPAVLYDIDGEERPETTYKGADQPEVEIIPTAIIADQNKVIHTYQLYQNYPNPFNPVTTIRYDIPENAKVKLEIYNLIGQMVETIDLGLKKNGSYRYYLDMSDHATGIYLYKLRAGKFKKSRKMLLVK
jgi:hypothetical protein